MSMDDPQSTTNSHSSATGQHVHFMWVRPLYFGRGHYTCTITID